MTATGLEQLRGELELLRHRVHEEIAQRFRDARSYGHGSNNDEHHAILEDQIILEARIALLDETVGRAVIVSPEEDEGVAVIGATVLIEDPASGEKRRHRLASAHSMNPNVISAASPMGQALMGARAGDVVTLDLPNGSSRSVRLLAVEAGQPGAAVKVPTTAP